MERSRDDHPVGLARDPGAGLLRRVVGRPQARRCLRGARGRGDRAGGDPRRGGPARPGAAGAPVPAVTDIREQLSAWAEEMDIELIFFDPPETFDHAIVGVVAGYNQEPAVLYDEAAVLAALARDLGGDEEAAREWFEFNTAGAYLGEATPRFLTWRPEAPEAPEAPARPAGP